MCDSLESEARRDIQDMTGGAGGAREHDDFGAKIRSQLESELDAICSRGADLFNNDDKFQTYLKEELEMKRAAVQNFALLDGS